MRPSFLLPHSFKRIGWILLFPATVLGIALTVYDFNASWMTMKVFAIINDPIVEQAGYFVFTKVDITNTAAGTFFLLAALMVAFSREKNEDEYINRLRLSSLLWAVWVNYLLLLLALLFVYGTPFMTVMIYNMFTVLIFFIIRFNYILYRSSKPETDEE